MKAEGVHLLFWLLGTIGVAGTVALFFLAPSAFAIAFKAIGQFFGLVIQYRVGCAVLALVAGLLIGDYWRAGRDAAEWKARVAAFEQAKRDRDTRIATETEAAVRKELAEAAENNVTIDNAVKDFRDVILVPPPSAAVKGNPYAIGEPDRLRLCRIAGLAECGPRSRTKGVPVPRPRKTNTRDQRLPNLILRGFS